MGDVLSSTVNSFSTSLQPVFSSPPPPDEEQMVDTKQDDGGYAGTARKAEGGVSSVLAVESSFFPVLPGPWPPQ